MRDVLKDEKLKKLLKEKQRLEMFSWIIPLVSILLLILILVLTSSESLKGLTIIVLILLILLIIGGYIFDNKITIKIHHSYSLLNEYFQDNIVPRLLEKDNPSITYHEDVKVDPNLIDKVMIFNNFTDYQSYFNYTGLLENHQFSFNEVMFDMQVDYDTTEQKVFNKNIKNEINYHWFTFELNKEYPGEALYLISKFDSYDGRLIKGFQRVDLTNSRINLNYNYDLDIYVKAQDDSHVYTTNKILKTLNMDIFVYNSILAIYVTKNQLHIIIEEVEDLIDLTHSNKIALEGLLKGYYDEQKLIKLLVKAFD